MRSCFTRPFPSNTGQTNLQGEPVWLVLSPDGNSAFMLVCARLRYVAGTQWGNKKYMNIKHLEAIPDNADIAG